MNIVDPILHQCRINAEEPAIYAPGSRFELVTYAQLEYMMNNIGKALLPHGFQPGQIVGISIQDDIFHIALALALTRIGAITVSSSTVVFPAELNAAAIVTDSSGSPSGAGRVIRANPEWATGNAGAAIDPRQFTSTGDEICRITLTSGSTGTPKAIEMSHRMLMGRNAKFDYYFGARWSAHSRIYCDLGMASGPAFRFMLHMLMRGGMIMFYGRDPMVTEQSLDLFRIQCMVTSPGGLAEHLKFYERTKMRCALEDIVVTGGSIGPELVRRTWESMSPVVFTDYGATEVGTVASVNLRDVNDRPGRIGYVVPPALVEAVDDNDMPLGPDAEGAIRLRTPFMAGRYLGQPELSKRFFRNGWFYPGDYGYVAQDGLLVVSGRLETRINVGGDKINPEHIEDVLKGFAGLEDAAVLGVPNARGVDNIHALVKIGGFVDAEALRAYCQSRLSRHFVPVSFVPVDRIPRNEAGKIQRSELPGLFAKSRN